MAGHGEDLNFEIFRRAENPAERMKTQENSVIIVRGKTRNPETRRNRRRKPEGTEKNIRGIPWDQKVFSSSMMLTLRDYFSVLRSPPVSRFPVLLLVWFRPECV